MLKVFLDVETTGIKPSDGDRVIEVGAVALDGGRQVDGGRFHEYVHPDRDIPEESTRIHGITITKLAGKPGFEGIAERLAEFIRGHELLAHNAQFDVSFLDMEFKKLGMPQVKDVAGKVTDTLEMARRMYPGRSNSLDALAERAGIDVAERRPVHSAIVDAEILAEVHLMMTRGQSALDLEAHELDVATDVPPLEKIEVVALPEREGARAEHERYLSWMRGRSGVRPMAMEKKDG